MTVKINGQTTNFSGVGTVNPKKLVIPRKNQMDQAAQAAMLAIEQWCNNLSAPAAGSSFYTSLTGPGETVTPGDLTQAGGFTVNDNASAMGINLNDTGGGLTPGINFTAGAGSITTSTSAGNIAFNCLGVTNGNFQVSCHFGFINGVTGVRLESAAGTPCQIQFTSTGTLGFFAAGPAGRQTVTGSRGGNVALASLLTALANYGLIIDSSSP